MGQKILQTGPLHGVTQWPRSVYWAPESPDQAGLPVQIELIDTPGLDEIEGQARAEMAQDIAQQADLILFVVAGDITRTEYQALQQLRQAQKPILLVFNKVDLYPDQDRQVIYQKLKTLDQQTFTADAEAPIASPDDIVMVAAEPAPMEVRVEWPDGRVTQEWEAPPAQIEELKQKLLQIVQTEGRSLLALNALRQSREAESRIAQRITELQQAEAEALIWKYAKYKALAIAFNPVAVLDVMGGAIADLMMIRALARLYGLPMTGYEAGKLWRAILKSSGSTLLSELGSGLLLGLGKSAAAVTSIFESPSGLMAYAGAMAAQAGAAGYGTYIVGQAAQVYLEQGCTWGPQGANTVIQDILQTVEPDSILERLRQELELPTPSSR
jgi:GTPase SAR1 family protein